ncbi:MAG: class I SAM-dependent methyltransferase [Brevundimonas sp.]|uniref:SAM-dependent methyltransferase n=1 Tax=Brevundimonas sp. TaxID=1871086 RepID=UPI0025BF93A7|nr:cyclopropane-fatty-acyl-phospholipid synthase family protein [Brevundimonas sp.]MBX3478119.1 class I SAM-dependent methyltransferase [Brevundimonas sp.]
MTDQAFEDDAAPEGPPRAPFWARPLLVRLGRLWGRGRLDVVLPGGGRWRLGREARPHAVWRVRRWRALARMVGRGDIGFAEGYLAGDWDTPDLTGLLVAFADNYEGLARIVTGSRLLRGLDAVGHALSRNSRRGARRNIVAHYDLGNAFYAGWLDPGMTYSSALFDRPNLDLEQAQSAKYAALADAAGIGPDSHVLEIGCGWGGFAEYAARERGARVTAITLSPSQKAYAEARMAAAGLADRVQIRLIDYRDVAGRFDAVVSIEMFEAVGEAYWPVFFGRVRDLLAPGGRAALQIITIRDDLFDSYRRRPDFIQMHVFPGGMLPSRSVLDQLMAEAGLAARVERRMGPDYARTLAEWRERFDAWAARADDPPTPRFQRLWRYYLGYCEAGFRTGRIDVVQVAAGRAP